MAHQKLKCRCVGDPFFFSFSLWKVISCTYIICKVMTISNTTCTTQALLELSFEYNSIGPHHASSTYWLLSTNQRSFSNKEKKSIKQRKHCVPSGIMEIVMGRVCKVGIMLTSNISIQKMAMTYFLSSEGDGWLIEYVYVYSTLVVGISI